MKKMLLSLCVLAASVLLLTFTACGGEKALPGPADEEITAPQTPQHEVEETWRAGNYEFAVTESVSFAEDVRSGGTVQRVFQPRNPERIFAYVAVEFTNMTEERRQMFPSRLQSPTQLTARLRYIGEEGDPVAYLPTSLTGIDCVIDRPVNGGDTTAGRLFFEVPPEIEHSDGALYLVIRTNEGDVLGEVSVR